MIRNKKIIPENQRKWLHRLRNALLARGDTAIQLAERGENAGNNDQNRPDTL